MKKNFLLLAISLAFATSCISQNTLSITAQLEKATNENKTALVVLSDNENSGEKLNEILIEAVENEKNISVIEVNKSNEASDEFIAKYNLGTAPLPLLLIFSSKGDLLGGLSEEQASVEAIKQSIPSPKLTEITYNLNQGKGVIAVISNDSFANNKATASLANDAKTEIGENVEIVEINTQDAAESNTLRMFNLNSDIEDSHIMVINTQGLLTGRFDKLPTKDELVTAATQIVNSSCGAGGCGPTCN